LFELPQSMPRILVVAPAGWGRDHAAPAVVVELICAPAVPALPPAKQSVAVGQLMEKYQAKELALPS
jgi:hypothetical protein